MNKIKSFFGGQFVWGAITIAVVIFAGWCIRTNGWKALIIAVQYPEYVSTLELQKKIVVKK